MLNPVILCEWVLRVGNRLENRFNNKIHKITHWVSHTQKKVIPTERETNFRQWNWCFNKIMYSNTAVSQLPHYFFPWWKKKDIWVYTKWTHQKCVTITVPLAKLHLKWPHLGYCLNSSVMKCRKFLIMLNNSVTPSQKKSSTPMNKMAATRQPSCGQNTRPIQLSINA